MVLQFFFACNMNPLLNFLERKRTGLRAGSCKYRYTSKYKLQLKKNCRVKFGLICQASPFIPPYFTFVIFLQQNVCFSTYLILNIAAFILYPNFPNYWPNGPILMWVVVCLQVFLFHFLPFPGPSYMHFEHKDSLIVLKLFIWGAKHLIR